MSFGLKYFLLSCSYKFNEKIESREAQSEVESLNDIIIIIIIVLLAVTYLKRSACFCAEII